MSGLSRYRFASQVASSGVATTNLSTALARMRKQAGVTSGVLAYQQRGSTETPEGGR